MILLARTHTRIWFVVCVCGVLRFLCRLFFVFVHAHTEKVLNNDGSASQNSNYNNNQQPQRPLRTIKQTQKQTGEATTTRAKRTHTPSTPLLNLKSKNKVGGARERAGKGAVGRGCLSRSHSHDIDFETHLTAPGRRRRTTTRDRDHDKTNPKQQHRDNQHADQNYKQQQFVQFSSEVINLIIKKIYLI